MENYIFISGIPLWIFLVLLSLIVLSLILLGRAYITTANENVRLKQHNTRLRQENILLEAERNLNLLKNEGVNRNV